MFYYRMTNKNGSYFPHIKETIVFDELKTKRELDKMRIHEKSACFEIIYTSRKNTFKFFGIRYLKDERKVF